MFVSLIVFRVFFWFILLFVNFNSIGLGLLFELSIIFERNVVWWKGDVVWKMELFSIVKIFLCIKDLLIFFGILYCNIIDGVSEYCVMLWLRVIRVLEVGIIDFFFFIFVDIVVLGLLIGIFVLLL